MNKITQSIDQLISILSSSDLSAAAYLEKIKRRPPSDIATDLNIWGGSGSLMDQGLYGHPPSELKAFYSAAIDLAESLIAVGAYSDRMKLWLDVNKKWNEK
jgi:hypothetical protein